MVAPEERLTIDAGSTQVSGVYARPDRPFAAIVVAHGAGAGMDHPFLVGFSRAINELDVATLRFNFPYMERGRRSPDSEPAAIEAWRAALDVASKRGSGLPIFASGKACTHVRSRGWAGSWSRFQARSIARVSATVSPTSMNPSTRII